MSSLELRAIAYACAAAFLVIMGAKAGMHHVQAQWNIDKIAQQKVVAKAQADLIEANAARSRLESQVQVDHEQLAKNSAAAVAAVSDSVRSLGAAIQAGALSGSMDHSGKFAGPATGPGSVGDLQASIARFTASIDGLTKACTHDSDNYASILELAPKPAPVKPGR